MPPDHDSARGDSSWSDGRLARPVGRRRPTLQMPSRTSRFREYTSFCHTVHKSMDSNARPSVVIRSFGRFGGGAFYAGIRQKDHSQTVDQICTEMGTSPHRRKIVGIVGRTVARRRERSKRCGEAAIRESNRSPPGPTPFHVVSLVITHRNLSRRCWSWARAWSDVCAGFRR